MNVDLVVLNIDSVLSSRTPQWELRRHAEVRRAASAASLLRARGRRVVLASSLATQTVDGALAETHVARDAFDDVVTTELSTGGRPNIMRRVIDQLGVPGTRAAAIACGPIDLYEALGAGCETIVAVATSRHAAWELRRHPHTAIASTVLEAAELVAFPRPGLHRPSWRSCNELGNPR
jgi:beta-phosphoglucomutase-like phosphatase (HAD superfamily)